MSDRQQSSRISSSAAVGKRRPPHKEIHFSRAQRARTSKTRDDASPSNSISAVAELERSRFVPNGTNESTIQACEESETETCNRETIDDVDRLEPCHLKCDCSIANPLVLDWKSHPKRTSLEAEESLIPVLVKYGERERNMMCNHPPHRLRQISRACHRLHVPLAQALSLRRHHIKRLNPYASMSSLLLGSNEDIRVSAALFEESVARMLHDYKIEYWNEEDQKSYTVAQGERVIATPDFLLKRQILIRRCAPGRNKHLSKPQPVCWIDAKMFYGASSIEQDNRSAVGCLMGTAQKYVQLYGPGAFVFMNGCGAELSFQLEKEGVLALDCTEMISLDRVREHQRTWCGDSNGKILP